MNQEAFDPGLDASRVADKTCNEIPCPCNGRIVDSVPDRLEDCGPQVPDHSDGEPRESHTLCQIRKPQGDSEEKESAAQDEDGMRRPWRGGWYRGLGV